MQTCETCKFPMNQSDVDENIYELHRACSCKEDDLMVEFYNEEQSLKSDDQIKQEEKEWNQAADYIVKKGITPNLDSIY